MKDRHGKKIHILDARTEASQALLRSQYATMLDLAPLQEALLNVGAGLNKIATLLQDFEDRIGVLELDAMQAQSIHPSGPYGLKCSGCGQAPRWTVPFLAPCILHDAAQSDPNCPHCGLFVMWRCMLGCGKTPVRADGPGSRWLGNDLRLPAVLT